VNQPPDGKNLNPNVDAALVHPKSSDLTTNEGLRMSEDQNSLRAGERGPTLLEDFHLREKIMHFDHERIPERVVHARGSGAHGYFQVYEPMTEYTQAKFLQDPSVKTPVFVRFSQVVGSRGSADTVRDVRGFATKFYTEEGNFDLVGNNMPVFFIQDAVKFPDFVHAVKPEPHHEMPQAASAHDTFWDFIWLSPESMHMIMWVMSDRAIPRSYGMMEGFGVHTFRFVNAQGVARFVKFHWKPLLGVHSMVWDEAQKVAGMDPDFLRRDLWESIDRGDYPEYEFGIQLIDEQDEQKFAFDVLDATKIWPEELVPVRRIGKMVLNRNPENFFAETEQVAFHLGHVVPGIDVSNDPLLQGRLFSYVDTQLLRLGGPNFAQLPINQPVAQVNNNQRDGFQQHRIHPGQTSYEPNSLGGGGARPVPQQRGGYTSYPARVDGNKVRVRSESFSDHFSQATMFWNSQSAPEKEHLVRALRFELGKVEHTEIRQHVVDLLLNVDAELATGVAAGIGVPDPAGNGGLGAANARLNAGWDIYGVTGRPGRRQPANPPQAPELSMANTVKGKVRGRRVALLAADGVNCGSALQLQKVLMEAGIHPEVIAPHLGMLTGADGEQLSVDKSLLTVASVMYDAVFIADGQQSAASLVQEGSARHFVSEAFKHCKPLGALGAGADLLTAADSAGSMRTDTPDQAAMRELGVLIAPNGTNPASVAADFIELIGQHRFFSPRQQEQVSA
jgi:catalase